MTHPPPRDTLKLLLNSSTFYALFLSMMAIAVGQLICGDFVKVFGSKEIKVEFLFLDSSIYDLSCNCQFAAN